MSVTADYGSWASPITSQMITEASVSFGDLQADPTECGRGIIYWAESRPQEGGRQVICSSGPDLTLLEWTPKEFNVRTKVHEYGGGSFCVYDGVVYFSNFKDQRVYKQEAPNETPQPVSAENNNCRYAEGVGSRKGIYCIRENHTDVVNGVAKEPKNCLILLSTVKPGEEYVIAEGMDFYGSPQLSPNQDTLAWMQWKHPNMPWDTCQIATVKLNELGHCDPNTYKKVAATMGVSNVYPSFAPDGTLFYISDQSDFYNLFSVSATGDHKNVCAKQKDLVKNAWGLGGHNYAFDPTQSGDVAVRFGGELAIVNVKSGIYYKLETGHTNHDFILYGLNKSIYCVAASPTRFPSVVRHCVVTGKTEVLRCSKQISLDDSWISIPKHISFPTGAEMKEVAYGYFYGPTNGNYKGPTDKLPPLLVMVHGGPTGSCSDVLDLTYQYYTSRGFAILDVNYRGSTGYGKKFRESLKGNWGIGDVEDCCNGAISLVNQGKVDGSKLAIRGRSSGGYTVLATLTFKDVFRVGVSHFGIGELEALATDTHKFEAHYLDSLIGPYPAAKNLYYQRSPIHFLSQLRCPVAFFQGLDDKIVPPSQSQNMYEELKKKGLPTSLVLFEGEGHGFKKAENIQLALDGEYYFICKVMGIEPTLTLPEEKVVRHSPLSNEMTSVNQLLEKNKPDPRVRLELAPLILSAVKTGHFETDQTSVSNFIDCMTQWMNTSNYKVALEAISILDAALDTAGEAILNSLVDNIATVMERLGDQKEPVRDGALCLLLKLMNVPGSSPQYIFDKLMVGFSHKQYQVKVSIMKTLQETLRMYGGNSLQLSKFTPLVCKLITDQMSQVRDEAANTLMELYMHAGDRMAQDIQKKKLLPDAKMATMFSRFEEAKIAGLVTPSAGGYNEVDAAVVGARGRIPRKSTMEDEEPSVSSTSKPPVTNGSVGGAKRSTSVPAGKRVPTTARYAGAAGAVDEEQFYQAFEDFPKLQIFSGKELVVQLGNIKEMLSDANNDWEKRVEHLKRFRGYVAAGASNYEEFFTELKSLEVPFQLAVKDLRSQVVREACISIAFLSEQIGIRLDHFAEYVLHNLINLIQNSAKVMATSGLVACRFIIKNTHAPRLIPIFTSSMNSKSREIRKAVADFLAMILCNWETSELERNAVALQEAVRVGLHDADPEARSSCRKAYWAFADHFRDRADALFQSLDATKQKQLKGEVSQSSSNNSISAAALRRGSQENLSRTPMIPGRDAPHMAGPRSTSDIDPGAARRAAMQLKQSVRQTRPPLQNINSLPRPTVLSTRGLMLPPDYSRARTPSKTVSLSQPGSRSNSPSSRIPAYGVRKTPRSSIPTRSNQGSREPSPGRTRRLSSTSESPSGYGQQRFLTQSKDMEQQIAEALRNRRASRGPSDEVDSETSSVCSEMSAARNGDTAEFRDALAQCASSQFGDRKDGLMAMQKLFRAQRAFTRSELKKICDVFTRLFVDPHNKTFNVFLDTLVEFLAGYRAELCDWLYMLLIRLLTKGGTDLLPSVQTKLTKTLAVVRESFPFHLQFNVLVRYLNDHTQTPTVKVKLALLFYMLDLIQVMDPSSFANSAENRQAVTKIIQWSMEQKSSDIKRASQNVLVALFHLNPPEMTMMLGTFPKHMQDIVYPLLQNHLQRENHSNGDRSRASLSPGLRYHSNDGIDMEDVHNSLRETSAEIQNYSFSTLDAPKGSQDSGIVDVADNYQKFDPDMSTGRLDVLTSFTDADRQQEVIAEILSELSNHNRRNGERKKALSSLKYMTRDGTFTLWEEHFKTILFILMETLGDDQGDIRALALRVLREISLCQAPRFRDYAELTILKLLEAHKDADKDVVRSAEDCASVLATHLPPITCLRVLNPIIQSINSSVLLAAMKMITKVIEQLTEDEVIDLMRDIVPGIVQAMENPDSGVRKASVFCLVAIHGLVGDANLQPYLDNCSPSKVKLLNLYIKKAQNIPSR